MKNLLNRNRAKLWYYDNGEVVEGLPSWLSGDASGLSGNVSWLRGDVSWLRGDASGLSGDVSGLRGDASGLSGNVSDCELTNNERSQGIDIEKLVAKDE
jgi:aggrecan 1